LLVYIHNVKRQTTYNSSINDTKGNDWTLGRSSKGDRYILTRNMVHKDMDNYVQCNTLIW
jgi:hypothetical protein